MRRTTTVLAAIAVALSTCNPPAYADDYLDRLDPVDRKAAETPPAARSHGEAIQQQAKTERLATAHTGDLLAAQWYRQGSVDWQAGTFTMSVPVEVTSMDCATDPCAVYADTVYTERVIDLASATAEDWRPVIAHYFPAGFVDLAVDLIACESRGNTFAQNDWSSAGGLFQFLDSTWNATEFGGLSKYDPEANIAAAAAWMAEGGWSLSWIAGQWECYSMVR